MAKVNGYRIYLLEIDNALRRITGISDACTVVFENSCRKKIVSFIISSCQYEKKYIKKVLLEELPTYMLPYDIVFVDCFPETINGKIDKKILIENYEKTISNK